MARNGVVLVTGATGFTGSHLVESLVASGQRVRALARSAQRAQDILPAGVEVVEGDVTDASAVERAMVGVDTVYHLAAAFREARHPTAHYYRVNVEGTRLLLEAALAHRVRRFVHCSTVGVVSHVEHPPGDETMPHRPGDDYQASKSEAEGVALEFHARHGLPVTIARPTPIYGPGDTRLLKMFRMVAQERFFILGSGQACFHMVHVDDLVAGLRLMAEHPRAVGEIFILGGEESPTLRTVLDLIAESVGARPPWLHLPVWPFMLAALVCEKVCVALGVEPPLHRRRVKFFVNNRAFTIEKAVTLLGYRPRVDLRRGIRQTADWYAARGLLGRRRAPDERRAGEDRRRQPRLTPVGH